MIDLFIDSYLIQLSAESTLNIISKNPFLTKEGEFTLDIDISLLVPGNKLAYSNIDRINNTINFKKDREVRLEINGKLALTGTEIVIESSSTSVKIQIVAGNSELNYKMKDLYIRNLDLGTYEFTPETANQANIGHSRVCCFPLILIKDESNITLRNNFPRKYIVGVNNELTAIEELPFKEHLIPQMYMSKAISILLETLGYIITNNVFASDERLKNIVIANGNHTVKFCEMLPNMSVNDFISKIEEAYSVYFNVDYSTKEISIEKFDSYISSKDPKSIAVLDDFNIKSMDEKDIYKGFVFKDDGSSYHKRMILKDSSILQKESVKFTTFANLIFSIEESGIDNLYNANMLYYVTQDDTYFYIAKENNQFILSKIGIFTDATPGEKRELSCVPCSCNWHTIEFRAIVENKPSWDVVWNTDISLYIPFVIKTLSTADQFIDDAVMNGIKTESKSDIINTFFYAGEQNIDLYYGLSTLLLKYPLAFEDYIDVTYRAHSVDYSEKTFKWASMINDTSRTLSFRPGESNNIIEEYIDNSKEYQFKLIEDIKSTDIVNIRNRLFVCKETTSQYKGEIFDKTGIFHPIKKH